MQCGVKQLYLAGHCWCRLQTLPPCLSAPASRLPPLAPLSHPPAQTTSHFTQISSCTITLHFTQTSYCTNNITFLTDFLVHKQHHISHKLPPAQTHHISHAAVVCAVLESISGLEPSSVLTEPRYFKLVAVKLLSVHFDLCVDATGVVCHQLSLLSMKKYNISTNLIQHQKPL